MYTGLHAYFNELVETLAVAFYSINVLVLQTMHVANKNMTKNVIHKTKQNKHWTICHFEKYKVIKTKETKQMILMCQFKYTTV